MEYCATCALGLTVYPKEMKKWNEGLRLKWRYHRRTVAGALFNLGSGSWLTFTVVPWRKLVAAHSPRWRTIGPIVCSQQEYYTAISHGLHPVIRVPNYMDHYSFTDPWGMGGWVGHVGWPIADGLTTKWSPIQLAVWCKIRKVRRPRTAF